MRSGGYSDDGQRSSGGAAARMVREVFSGGETGWEEVRPILDGAIASLPRILCDTIVLRYLMGMSREEVAREMSCSELAVRIRLTRALARLRRNLSRKAVRVSEALLASFLAERVVEAAPAGLTATVEAVCTGTVAASADVSAMAERVMKAML
jgi:hypothetical protein